MKTPDISVVMTNRSDARWIRKSIESVLEGSYGELELIVVDDASQDNSPEIIRELAARDPRIKPIFLPQNAGISAARNIGIDAAVGAHISLLDSDDCFMPETLEQMKRLFTTVAEVLGDTALLITDALLINENDDARGRYMNKEWQGVLALGDFPPSSSAHLEDLQSRIDGLTVTTRDAPSWCLPSTYFFKKSNQVRFADQYMVGEAPIFIARMAAVGRIIYDAGAKKNSLGKIFSNKCIHLALKLIQNIHAKHRGS